MSNKAMNDVFQKIIQNSTCRGLSSNEEKIILEYLKSISELEAIEYLKYMVDQKSLVSLPIAKRVLRTKDYIKKFFEYGIVNSNAQSIKQWLDFAIPLLGFKSVVYLIDKLNTDSNKLMDKAVYWLPNFIIKNDVKSRIILDNLIEKAKKTESINEN